MPLRSASVLARIAAPVLCGLLLTGCGDDPVAQSQTTPGSSSLSQAECEALLPGSVLDDLGWSATGGVDDQATSCSVQADEGSLEVGRVLGGASDPQAAYDDACDELAGQGLDAADPTFGISGDFEICATGDFPASGTGIAEAVVISPDDVVSSIQLAASTETSAAAVRAALSALAANAATTMPAPR